MEEQCKPDVTLLDNYLRNRHQFVAFKSLAHYTKPIIGTGLLRALSTCPKMNLIDKVEI